jgi:hypothetical protein
MEALVNRGCRGGLAFTKTLVPASQELAFSTDGNPIAV